MPRKTGLKLFLKTWPLKKSSNGDEEKAEENRRPLTATLEKPTILDIRYVGKIDMSLIRKEFLSITNLCRIPLVIQTSKIDNSLKESSSIVIKRPLSLPPPRLRRPKTKKIKSKNEKGNLDHSSSLSVDCSDLDVASIATNASGDTFISNKIKKCSAKSKLPKKNHLDDQNNNINNKSEKNKSIGSRKIVNKALKAKQLLHPAEDANQSQEKAVSVPEPCRTCGRSDQPERFHSHPVSTFKRKSIVKIESNNNQDLNKTNIGKIFFTFSTFILHFLRNKYFLIIS